MQFKKKYLSEPIIRLKEKAEESELYPNICYVQNFWVVYNKYQYLVYSNFVNLCVQLQMYQIVLLPLVYWKKKIL